MYILEYFVFIMRYQDNSKYEGEWKDDNRHGKGIMYLSCAKISDYDDE